MVIYLDSCVYFYADAQWHGVAVSDGNMQHCCVVSKLTFIKMLKASDNFQVCRRNSGTVIHCVKDHAPNVWLCLCHYLATCGGGGLEHYRAVGSVPAWANLRRCL